MLKTFIVIFYLIPIAGHQQLVYKKQFNEKNLLIAEGWMMNNKKTKYWKFYYSDGKLKEEGHYCNNLRCKYWFFYNNDGKIKAEGYFEMNKRTKWWILYTKGKLQRKTQYKSGLKHGFNVVYRNNEFGVFTC